MDFGLNEDQELLQRSAAEFLAAECSPSFVREVARDEEGFPRALYGRMAELGWMGLIIPESYGGAGLSLLELALLMEQLGRAVVPGPFFSSAVLASLAILHGGASAQKKTWLPRLASGEAIGALAWLEASDGWMRRAWRRAPARPKVRTVCPGRNSSSPTAMLPTCSSPRFAPPGAAKTA